MPVQTTYDFDALLSSAKEAYGEVLLEMADEGAEFVFTYTDNVAPSTTAGALVKKYPERCFNFGIAEPNQVGASCGLALATGLPVFSQVFGPFLSLRAADQIHTDIAYNDVNVRLIGTHSGATAGGGPTHNTIADLALYRAIPNLTICVPADADQCKKFIRASMDYAGPMIIRIDRGGSPNLYSDTNYNFKIGEAIEVLDGDDITIISCGTFLYWSLMAVKLLKEKGVSARLVDMHTIKPLDLAAIDKSARLTKAIVTVEEASINGGLGSAVAERLAETGFGGKFARMGLPDEFLVLGPPDEVYDFYGISPEKIADRVLKLLDK